MKRAYTHNKNVVRSWRTDLLGLSQVQTATLTGFSLPTVKRAEAGTYTSLGYIIRLANLTGQDYREALTADVPGLI